MSLRLPTQVRRLIDDETLARRGLFLLMCIGFVVSVAFVGSHALSANGFPLDDSWIHQVIGRNLAELGVLAFTPGMAGSGSTSTIWPFIIALNDALLPGISPVAFMLAVNAACFFIVATTIFLAANHDRLPPAELACFAVLPVLTGNFVWLIATGMEHLLYVATSLVAAYLWISGQGMRNAVLSGFCIGLAITTRLEAAALVPVFLIGGWLRRRSFPELALFCVAASFGLLSVVVVNYWTSGKTMPVTLSGRRWLWFGDTPAPWQDLALAFANAWLARIKTYFLMLPNIGGMARAETLAILSLFCAGLFRLVQMRAHAVLFAIATAATTVAIYLIMLPAPGHGGRYQAILMPFILPLMALGAVSIARGLTLVAFPKQRAIGIVAQAACLAVAVLIGSVSVNRWGHLTELGIAHVNNTHVRMGKWIDETLPHDATLAVFDIGAIAYYSHRRIVDLGGLVDPEFPIYREKHALGDYIRRSGSTWVVLPSMYDGPGPTRDLTAAERLRLDHRQLSLLKAFTSPEAVWRPGFDATLHAFPAQHLFRMGLEPAGEHSGNHADPS
jgi:hypothetical protein